MFINSYSFLFIFIGCFGEVPAGPCVAAETENPIFLFFLVSFMLFIISVQWFRFRPSCFGTCSWEPIVI